MNKEIEIKILEINPNKIKKILKKNKAKFIKRVLQKNVVYDNAYTKSKGVTVRLRKEGKEVSFTIKSPKKVVRGHKVREEYETNLENFEVGEKMLIGMGLKKIAETEAKREYYKWDKCSVEIVKMPKIPVFLEIEGLEKDIAKVVKKLDYSKKDYFSGYPPVHYKISFKKLVFK